MNIIMILALLFPALLLLGGFAAGNYFYNLALNPRADRGMVFRASHNAVDYDAEAATQRRRDNEAWFASVDVREEHITAEDGTSLHGYAIVQKEPADTWLIACHGYTTSAMQMIGTARSFYRQGFHVLLPNLRGHGTSGGHYIAMGWHDRRDLICWINTILAGYGNRVRIVLYGVSMGGSAVMMAAGEADLPPNVAAVVEDCGFSSAWDEFSYQLHQLYGLPPFPLMHITSLITRLRAGYFLGEADARAQVARAKVPILFIHGTEDKFVPAHMVEQLYDACVGEKEKLVVPGAGHGGAWLAQPQLYDETVLRFIHRYIHDLPVRSCDF